MNRQRPRRPAPPRRLNETPREQELIALNKPYGYICQFSPHEKHRSLKELLPLSGYYTAGRLDTDSEGLLLLTNNGRLQAEIADPRHKTVKTYWAQLERKRTRLNSIQGQISRMPYSA